MILYRRLFSEEERGLIKSFPLFLEIAHNQEECLNETSEIFGAVDSLTVQLVGYAILEPRSGDLPHNIQFIEVDPLYQKRGIGTGLINSILDYLVQNMFREVCLMAHDKNSLLFFNRNGFIEISPGGSLLIRKL